MREGWGVGRVNEIDKVLAGPWHNSRVVRMHEIHPSWMLGLDIKVSHAVAHIQKHADPARVLNVDLVGLTVSTHYTSFLAASSVCF